MGCRTTGVALGNNVAGTTFASSALRGYTQLELNLVETHAGTGMAGDFTVRNSVADADDHGLACWVKKSGLRKV